ncbi:MAG: signal peptidase I [Clostridia bacterium]|nr:signal peptidase I [Clostridia bacterium]
MNRSIGAQEEQVSKENERRSTIIDFLEVLVIAAVLAAIIRLFLFTPFYIPSSSMEPALEPGDRIIVNKILYHFAVPQRGDIVVFRYPVDPSRDFVKRIIGLPGETVEVRNSRVYINGRPLEESYLPSQLSYPNYGPIRVPQGSFFVMGDNRPDSDDSRVWGCLPDRYLIGKAVLIFWPLDRLRWLH